MLHPTRRLFGALTAALAGALMLDVAAPALAQEVAKTPIVLQPVIDQLGLVFDVHPLEAHLRVRTRQRIEHAAVAAAGAAPGGAQANGPPAARGVGGGRGCGGGGGGHAKAHRKK